MEGEGGGVKKGPSSKTGLLSTKRFLPSFSIQQFFLEATDEWSWCTTPVVVLSKWSISSVCRRHPHF